MTWLVSDCEHSPASSGYVLCIQKVIFHTQIIPGDNRFVHIYTYIALSLIQSNNNSYSNHNTTLLTKVAALPASFNGNTREIGDGV
jgi:3-hydroxymyristoyl/3-hydroxydecanoyl-(acyl carrier protein) dehydratase